MATMGQAIRLALHYAETELSVRHIFGQDVGPPLGGIFTLTQGLERAWNSPLDERGIVGTAAGLALLGERSVAEIQFGDYVLNTIDILRLIGVTCWASAGQFPMGLVLLVPVGAGIHGGIYHSHSVESLLCQLPGWRVVMPSTVEDAFGLLVSAVESPDPVAYLAPKALLRAERGSLPGEPADLDRRINAPLDGREQWRADWPSMPPVRTPLGVARVVREGTGLCVVSWGRMVRVCERALEQIADVELLDLRSLLPWDRERVVRGARRTGRLLVVNEDRDRVNFGEHVLRVVSDTVPGVRTRLLASRSVPGIGLAEPLESWTIPGEPAVRAAVRELLEG